MHEVVNIAAGFAGRIDGLNIVDAVEADIDFIKKASAMFPVLLLPGQNLTQQQQLDFAAKFGPIDHNKVALNTYSPGARSEFIEISNVGDESSTAEQVERRRLMDLGNRLWHTDSSYKEIPCHLSMLYGIKVTEKGGETQFVDLRAAYDALPEEMRTLIDGLAAAHSGMHARIALGFDRWSDIERQALAQDFPHPIVRTLPESGRKTLYLSSHASHIVGMPVPEGRILLQELTELATASANIYTHRWQPNDLVIWDNRCTMHRLRRYDVETAERVLRRVSTLDVAFSSRPAEPAID